MIIDKSYFILDISLPNDEYSNIDLYIQRFENEFLKKAFGSELADKLKAGHESVTDIINGAEYNVNGKSVKWKGLKNDEKISPIAYYVYYWYRRNTITYTTNVGEKKAKGENAASAEIGVKMAKAWDNLKETLNECYDYLIHSENDYGEVSLWNPGNINAFDL